MINPRKLGAYLDEVADDPETACKIMAAHNIKIAALRRAWSSEVVGMNDQATQRLKQLLDAYGISAGMIVSDLGKVDCSELDSVSDEELRRPFLTANYFGAPLITVGCGVGTGKFDLEVVKRWMSRVSDLATKSCVVPLLEVTQDSVLFSPTDLALAMGAAPKWRLLYDPTQFLLRRSLDPYVRYWILFRDLVQAVDLRDIKVGQGPRPIGVGDCKWDETLSDREYSGMYFLEPGLGRRYADAVTTDGTFEIALSEVKKHF